MFDRIFSRSKSGNKPSEISNITTDPKNLAFEMLILKYLERYNIDIDGNKSLVVKTQNEEDINWIKQTLEVLGFFENIEEIIIADWDVKRKLNSSITPKEFVVTFLSEFHNFKIENVAPEFVKERNKKLFEAYRYVINTVERIQGLIEDERLRTRIESDFRKKPGIQATMFQCTTPFFIVSLGCDQLGRYNLVYSVDFRFQDMISENFASTLIRRIYEFTPGEMEPFVRIGSLCTDCIDTFNNLTEKARFEGYHKITTQAKRNND